MRLRTRFGVAVWLLVAAVGMWTAQAQGDVGSIVAWGSNTSGQCNVPAPDSNFIAVAADGNFSLGLKDDGSVIAWGDNYWGQCNVPAPNSDFIAIAAGANHSLGVKTDGSIVQWGSCANGQCPPPSGTGFVAVSGGGAHSLALKTDESVVAWGHNYYGQCDVPAPNSGFVAISAGMWHSLGLRSDGSIAAWGRNAYGQCTVPLPNSGFIAAAGGEEHSLGLRREVSDVASWDRSPAGMVLQNRPNPFNPVTSIVYRVPEAGPVRLRIYDLQGRLIRTLVDEAREQGWHASFWDGSAADGRTVASGTYLCRLHAGRETVTGKMNLAR